MNKLKFSFLTVVKMLSFLIIFFGLSYFLFAAKAHGLFLSKEEKYFYQKLRKFEEAGEKKILLKDLTKFTWDTAVGHANYTPYEGDNYLEFFYHKKLVKKIGNDGLNKLDHLSGKFVQFSGSGNKEAVITLKQYSIDPLDPNSEKVISISIN